MCPRQRAQYRLLGYAEQLQLWAKPTTSLSSARTQMNDVADKSANEALRNEVLATASPYTLEMMLRLHRKRTRPRGAGREKRNRFTKCRFCDIIIPKGGGSYQNSVYNT